MVEDINSPDADIEIGEVENFSGMKEILFSHSGLVMSALRKCLDAGSCEMRQGYVQKKVDRNGNTNEIYIEDGRKKFINCVERAAEIMCCDFDTDAEENISSLVKEFANKKLEFVEEEKKYWDKLQGSDATRMMASEKVYPMKGFIVLPLFKELLTEYQLEIYKSIFAELNLLTKRLDFYKSEQIEA